jgi:integrase
MKLTLGTRTGTRILLHRGDHMVQRTKVASGTRKQRVRSPHPGVVLLKPDPAGRHPKWRARYRDPDSGRIVKTTLDPKAVRTKEARRDWAVVKSKSLAKRRMDLEGGAARKTGLPLSEAVKRYYDAHTQLRPATLTSYRAATNKLLAWAARERIRTGDEITRAKLLGFREGLIREPKRAAAAGEKRGRRKKTDQTRAPASINREIRGVRVVLGYLNELDLLPRINEGDLRRALKKLPLGVERTEYLKPAELRELLDAALRHDEERFAETRAEHRGLLPVGSTAKFEPVAPFLATLLLTGMRKGEAVNLDVEQVDLNALDGDGKLVGEIHLTAATKTKRARTVDLAVSPALRDLLAILLEGRTSGRVFPFTADSATAVMKRLRASYGAPKGFDWQGLRRTCGTFLTNAPGIFGAASAYRSARQLGHSVAVAEKHYLGLERGIPREARDLETAMNIGVEMTKVIGVTKARAATTERKSA